MPCERALGQIRRGQRVFLGTACGEPLFLVEKLLERADELADVKLLHYLSLSRATTPEQRFDRRFRHNALFVGPTNRQAINEARADYTPVMTSEIPRLFRERVIPIDVALIQVSPPDRWGYVSLGVSVDITRAAVECASLVIAQVNPRMPRTLGESFIHTGKIDAFVEHEAELLEFDYPVPDETGYRIAANAARLISDGDTVHMGYGQLPYAVLEFLHRREHLGVHTEVVGEGLIDLIDSGVVTGERKTLHPGKVVASFCIGSRQIYDYIDQNPHFRFLPADYVYNPAVICRNDNMVSIGAALEVDLSGQVCSESLGHHFYSGLGGRLDFMRGAAMSRGGRALVCLPSTTRDGRTSRIVHHLAEGAGVVATRGDVDYVVTEYGIVSLKGKSVRERAMALISVAHPKFRRELLEQAKAKGKVYPDQIYLDIEQERYPYWVEREVELGSGLKVNLRPIKPTDEVLLQDFFYSHSEETIYKRYFRPLRALPHDTAQDMVNLDYRNRMAVVATAGEIGREWLVGVARYAYEPTEDRAEMAITLREEFHGQGLGTLLQYELARYARAMGFQGLTALVLDSNKVLLGLFGKLGPYHKKQFEPGILKLWIDFKELSPEAEEVTRPLKSEDQADE